MSCHGPWTLVEADVLRSVATEPIFLGIVAGLSVWLTAAFAGVATLVRVYPQAMTVLQVTGGLLLATLGVLGLRSWRRARNPLPAARISYRDRGSGSAGSVADSRVGGAALPPRADFLRGLATNLANPKALVFFGAVLTPFLQGEMSAGSSVAVVVGMIERAAARPRRRLRVGMSVSDWLEV